MPALGDDMNLRTGAIDKPHETFGAQEPVAERRACGIARAKEDSAPYDQTKGSAVVPERAHRQGQRRAVAPPMKSGLALTMIPAWL
jgi:hypothetical protein